MWIVKCTPFAIISLIAAAVGAQSDLGEVFSQVGMFVLAVCVGFLLQFLLVYAGLYLFFVRKNPFKYYRHLFPAMMLAFSSESSAATIPVSIDCAVSSGDVPSGIANFVIPFGVTINMDGMAIEIICASVWLAYQNGIVLGAGDYVVLALAATLGSMGAAPVPASGIVMILTAYATAFGSTGSGPPAGLGYILPVLWLLDRFSTVVNVTGDMNVAAIVANKVNKAHAMKHSSTAAETETKE